MFRYEGLRLKIDNVKWASYKMINEDVFCCEVTLQDRVQEVTLRFNERHRLWTMERVSG